MTTLAVIAVALVLLALIAPRRKPEPAPKPAPGPVHTYYGGYEIDKCVRDVFSPIETVIAAVEHQIRREVAASKSYKADPGLIYDGHPWMEFVRSGGAAYLGWDTDYKPGPSPVQRRREQSPVLRLKAAYYAVGEEKPDITPIVRYDLNGRPIHKSLDT